MQWFWQVKNKSAITRLVLTFLTTICIIRPKIRFVCMLLYFWSRCLAKTIQYKELWCSYSFYKTGESWLWPRPYWENLSCLVSTYWYHHIFYVRKRLESSQIYDKDTKIVIGGHGIFFRGGRIFCTQNFFIAFSDVSRHAERFDAMLFLGEKNLRGGAH